MAVCWVILRGPQIYTVTQAVHSLLYIVVKFHLFRVVTWKYIIKYLLKCEGCTHFCEILYLFALIQSISVSLPTNLLYTGLWVAAFSTWSWGTDNWGQMAVESIDQLSNYSAIMTSVWLLYPYCRKLLHAVGKVIGESINVSILTTRCLSIYTGLDIVLQWVWRCLYLSRYDAFVHLDIKYSMKVSHNINPGQATCPNQLKGNAIFTEELLFFGALGSACHSIHLFFFKPNAGQLPEDYVSDSSSFC